MGGKVMAYRMPKNVWFRPGLWFAWIRWPRAMAAMRAVAKNVQATATDLAKQIAIAQSPVDEGVSIRRWGEIWGLHQGREESTEVFKERLLAHIRAGYRERTAIDE
jgi:hypothetical protein